MGIGEPEISALLGRVAQATGAQPAGILLNWNPDNLVDNQVMSLQFRRPDESVVATAVGYGCHPVTTGFDMYAYSADFSGAMREFVRRNTGGEAVFLQGAGGNVLPNVAFTENEQRAWEPGSASRRFTR